MKNLWVKPEIRAAFEAKIAECIAKVQPHTTRQLTPPTLFFRQIGRSAGKCSVRWGKCFIVINYDMLTPQSRYDEQLNSTLPHEVGHYLHWAIHNDLGDHGWQWKRIMGWMGADDSRCHQMDLTGVKLRQRDTTLFAYSCGCGFNHKLTAIRHRRHQAGRTRFCKRCRETLVYKGIIVNGITAPVAQRQIEVPRVPVVTPPRPVEPEPPKGPQYRVITKLVNGVLTNVRMLVES